MGGVCVCVVCVCVCVCVRSCIGVVGFILYWFCIDKKPCKVNGKPCNINSYPEN